MRCPAPAGGRPAAAESRCSGGHELRAGAGEPRAPGDELSRSARRALGARAGDAGGRSRHRTRSARRLAPRPVRPIAGRSGARAVGGRRPCRAGRPRRCRAAPGGWPRDGRPATTPAKPAGEVVIAEEIARPSRPARRPNTSEGAGRFGQAARVEGDHPPGRGSTVRVAPVC